MYVDEGNIKMQQQVYVGLPLQLNLSHTHNCVSIVLCTMSGIVGVVIYMQ